ncbi:hypothetical protein J7M02_07375 [Candidatus Aerophobetes bacterium]|nr:hypothetical protein [Candidatus Aerophobetes bacterium]
MKVMTPRERVLTTLRREIPDKVPKLLPGEILGYTPGIRALFHEKIGDIDPAEYFRFDVRSIHLNPTKKEVDFHKYISELPKGAFIDEWGVGHIPGSMYHYTKMIHPMREFKKVQEVESYPFPDITEDYRYQGLKEKVSKLKEKGWAVAGFAENAGMIFETSWYLRGYENLICDFINNPDLATVVLDKVTEIVSVASKKLVEAGIDILILGDDVATQRGLMMSLPMWRRWLKPRLSRVINSARAINPEIYIFYHSDGNCTDIIPELIEIGVDILNPVQPEVMDLEKIKKEYGNKLTFWGGIGTQTTMVFSTPKGIKEEVKKIIEILGKNGGLVLAPTHVLQPDVPWQNILAFFEGVEMYGDY